MVLRYLLRNMALLSQIVNCVFLGGHHDQTVSARTYLNRNKQGWNTVYKVINKIFFWQEDHCKESHESDIEFANEILKASK